MGKKKAQKRAEGYRKAAEANGAEVERLSAEVKSQAEDVVEAHMIANIALADAKRNLDRAEQAEADARRLTAELAERSELALRYRRELDAQRPRLTLKDVLQADKAAYADTRHLTFSERVADHLNAILNAKVPSDEATPAPRAVTAEMVFEARNRALERSEDYDAGIAAALNERIGARPLPTREAVRKALAGALDHRNWRIDTLTDAVVALFAQPTREGEQ